MKNAGLTKPRHRVGPAHQGFDPGDGLALAVVLRLVDQRQLIVVDRLGEVGQQRLLVRRRAGAGVGAQVRAGSPPATSSVASSWRCSTWAWSTLTHLQVAGLGLQPRRRSRPRRGAPMFEAHRLQARGAALAALSASPATQAWISVLTAFRRVLLAVEAGARGRPKSLLPEAREAGKLAGDLRVEQFRRPIAA